ncbi:MAG: cellulase family glycosylhydrolase, partial [Anaerolineae bacterium]
PWLLWTGPTQLRGANIYQRRVHPELDGDVLLGPGPVGPPYTQADFDALAALGANYVNVSYPGLYTETPPYVLDGAVQAHLDALLDMIAYADLFAVISYRTGPGRSDFTFYWDEVGDWFDERYLNDTVWQDAEAQEAWVEMWRHTAARYRDHPAVVGYDLMVEPNSNEVGGHALHDALEVWDPAEFYAEYGGTLYDWNQLYPRITAAVREVDVVTPILVGGNGYSAVEWLPYLEPTGDPRTVYVAHQYEPHQYTHQASDAIECEYPGRCDLDWDGEAVERFDPAWLAGLLEPLGAFWAEHDVPVAVNEFGVVRWLPGGAEFMDDQMALFEERGVNYALWVWDPAWAPWARQIDAFNFRHGPDPSQHAPTPNALQDVILAYWGRNAIRPSTVPLLPGDAGAMPLPLDKVRSWAYQLQGIGEIGAVDALFDSRYDMLVLEPTRTDWSSDDRAFDTAGMVARLQSSPAQDGVHRKLVLAYVDIGQAEDWRWYWTWSRDWNCRGDPPADWPDYILACDPDGWSGNFPVAYWHPAWKDLMIHGEESGSQPGRDYRSAVDEVLRDGFDGIYLDWVEGYEDEAVVTAARAAGVDPAAEMVAFIAEIRAYAQARRPGFLVVQQNAAALVAKHPNLLTTIDAIAQEEVWYAGDATDDWDDGDGYDWPQDPDLTGYYLEHLSRYQAAGLPVLVCEYALDHAAAAYADAYAAGFVPYVTRRSLSRLTTTPPPGY